MNSDQIFVEEPIFCPSSFVDRNILCDSAYITKALFGNKTFVIYRIGARVSIFIKKI